MHAPPTPDRARRPRLADRIGALWPLFYAIAWVALHAASPAGWSLTAGLRLAALVGTPRRRWGALAVAEAAAAGAVAYWHRGAQPWPLQTALALGTWCACALLVARLGPAHALGAGLPRIGPQLRVGAGAAAATGAAFALAALWRGAPPAAVLTQGLAAALADLAGIVALMPCALVLQEHWWNPLRLWAITLANGAVVLPALAVAAALASPVPAILLPALLLAAAALAWLARHHGVRATAVALALAAAAVSALAAVHAALALPPPPAPGGLVPAFATFGAVALLLAGSTDALRAERLATRTLRDRLWVQAQQLRAAATRLASQQEQERRHLGAELHDALGQDMTAIATRLHLIQRRTPDTDLDHELAQLRGLVGTAHGHLREAINHLHPVTVTRFGLVRALTIGPVAEMVRASGVRYECQVHGPVERLPADVATMLYRIGQEAATNAVRHGCGGFLRLAIALDADGDDAGRLELSVTDHAGELDVPPERLGHGLQSIRDRADALAAAYRFDARSGLPRHRLRMTVGLAAADVADAARERTEPA